MLVNYLHYPEYVKFLCAKQPLARVLRSQTCKTNPIFSSGINKPPVLSRCPLRPGAQQRAGRCARSRHRRYGLLHGDVHSVSTDAITRDRQQGGSNDRAAGAAQSGSEPKGQELEYAARISLDRTHMQVEDKLVKLGPGMAVTVEIKTGARSIISYLLSPLARYKQEALRER
jgi:hypothetical protein